MGDFTITHCRVISPGIDLADASVRVERGRVAAVYPAGSTVPGDGDTHDAHGQWLVPGFIDIHTHGAMGYDCSDGTAASVAGLAAAKVGEGVTTLLPTTMTMPREELELACRAVAGYRAHPSHARVPGVHVEGPFLNHQCAGAQNARWFRAPDVAEIDTLRARVPVAIVSLAPELAGGPGFIAAMTERGVICSLAHSAATHADFLAARAAGLRHLTHFGNQMRGLHHREIGCVGSGLIDPEVGLEIICDGIHLGPDMLRLITTLVPMDRLFIITDSIAAAGLPDGDYHLGGQAIVVADGHARLPGGALAGSTSRYWQGFRNLVEMTGLPASKVIQATSWNQARSIGLDGLGKIEPGFLADMVLLDAVSLEPRAVWIDGRRQF